MSNFTFLSFILSEKESHPRALRYFISIFSDFFTGFRAVWISSRQRIYDCFIRPSFASLTHNNRFNRIFILFFSSNETKSHFYRLKYANLAFNNSVILWFTHGLIVFLWDIYLYFRRNHLKWKNYPWKQPSLNADQTPWLAL